MSAQWRDLSGQELAAGALQGVGSTGSAAAAARGVGAQPTRPWHLFISSSQLLSPCSPWENDAFMQAVLENQYKVCPLLFYLFICFYLF